MLPTSFLERLTSVAQLRSFGLTVENRGTLRIPVNLKADAFCVSRDMIGKVVTARIKDVSAAGVGLLVSLKGGLPPEFVLGICPKGLDTHWMLCKTRRSSTFDGICTVIGASWEKILYPGQDIQPGLKVSTMLWLDVQGQTSPEDPFAEYLAQPPGPIHSAFRT